MASLIIITGASRGFGRSAALEFARTASNNLFLVLSGTDNGELLKTSELVQSARSSIAARTRTQIVSADLSLIDNLEKYAMDLFDQDFAADQRTIESITFVNNAGSLGPLAPVGAEVQRDAAFFARSVNLNVTASCFLTSELIRRANLESFFPQCRRFDVVNISSLAAVQPFESWSLYCAGKAARDMYHRVLAEEQKKATHGRVVRVLNYAPGPLDTNMQKEIRENPAVDKPTQDYFIALKENNQLIDPASSAERLVRLLNSGTFESGSHMDYYDIA